MKIRFLILLTCVLISSYSYSQVYVFIVCGNRGENRVKSDGVWKLLKTQSTITDFDEIETSGENCYLGLLHTSGRSIVIRKPGTYNADDLLKKVNTGNSTIASKYADFVYSKMTTVSSAPVSGKRGAGEEVIKLLIPKSGLVFGQEEIIKWNEYNGTPSYLVKVKNIFDESVKEFHVSNNLLKLDLNDPDFKGQTSLFITVESDSDSSVKSDVYGITRLNEEDYKNISDTFNQLKSDLNDGSPINNLIYASFFEDHKLFIDAATYYGYAIDGSPGVQDFEKMFNEFLTRNGIL